jgi:hypothetical protein
MYMTVEAVHRKYMSWCHVWRTAWRMTAHEPEVKRQNSTELSTLVGVQLVYTCWSQALLAADMADDSSSSSTNYLAAAPPHPP